LKGVNWVWEEEEDCEACNKTTGKVKEVTNKINPNTFNNYFLNIANTISCHQNIPEHD
jgi:hypothetical protein